MLSAVVVGVLAAQAQTVTFTHACARSSVVLEALGKELNMDLRPSGSVVQDYFFVRFDAVSSEEALSRIATTLNASWTDKGGVHYLGRSGFELAKESESESRALKSAIERFLESNAATPLPSVEELTKRYRELGTLDFATDTGWSRAREIDSLSPPKRALYKVLAAMGAREVSANEIGSEHTYSTSPTGMMKGLTPAMDSSLREMESEYDVIAEAIDRSAVGESRYIVNSPLKYASKDLAKKREYEFVVSRTDGGVKFQLWLTLTDARSRSKTQMGGITIDTAVIGKDASLLLAGLEAPVAPPPEHAAFQRELQFPSSATFTNLSIATQTALCDLVGNEPLSMLASDYLRQAAETKGWNVVAVLDDGGTFPTFPALGRLPSVGQYMKSVLARSEWTYDEGARILSVRPLHPRTIRAERHDRAAISRLLSDAAKQDWFDSACFAGLASCSATEEQFMETLDLVTRLFPGTPGAYSFGYRWLRLLDSLAPAQRLRTAPTMTQFSREQMNVNAIRRVIDLASGEKFLFGSPFLGGSWSTRQVMLGTMTPMPDLSHGLPESTYVQVSTRRAEAVTALPLLVNGTSYSSGIMLPDEYASRLASHASSGPSPDYSQVKAIPAELVVISVFMPQGVLCYTLATSGCASGVTYGPVSGLPRALRGEIEKQTAKHKGGGL